MTYNIGQVSRHRTMFVRLEEATRRAVAEAAVAKATTRREAEEAEKVLKKNCFVNF